MASKVNRPHPLNRLPGKIRRAIKIKLRVKRINYSTFFARHFGQVPYFDIDMGKTVDLRPYLQADSRKAGISAVMRLKNEQQFVETAIESVINCVDELVIVHNGCTDRTPEIIESCRLRHPDRIRIFHYEPRVFSPGSIEHRQAPMGSPNSMVNYYNYALAKTTRKIAVKIDGDELYLDKPFRRLTDDLRSGKHSTPCGLAGVNLWDENGEILVNAGHPLTSGVDKGFFTVSPQTFFMHYRHHELFTIAFDRRVEIMFYHLKGMKEDRGLANYCFQPHATTFSPAKVAELTSPGLISWDEFRRLGGGSVGLPHPATLGLRARRASDDSRQ